MIPVTKHHLKSPSFWIATGLGSGLIRPAPGTWGSLAALPFGVGLLFAGGVPGLACAILILIPLAFWSIRSYQATKTDGSPDPSEIVIDEVAGVWVALLAVPAVAPLPVLYAFVCFRFFDILKPWPVSYFDRSWKGPAGIIADDVMAGLYAAACVAGGHYAGFI